LSLRLPLLRGSALFRATLLAIVFFAAVLVCSSCWEQPEKKTGAQPSSRADTTPNALPEKTGPQASWPQDKPNVVLILADDLDKAVFERSTLESPWVPKGMSFTNALATTPLCCPSRASILRGQYAHNTGLVRNNNDQPQGGAAYFRRRGLDERSVATILQANGYKTWFGGKYLNGYGGEGEEPGYVPPGWDSWQAYISAANANVDGQVAYFPSQHYNVLRMQSALTLEDLCANVIDALERTNQLDDTYLIFTSDNGFHLGLHRIKTTKGTPYVESHEVPFVVRGPGVPAGASFDELAANIDLAPTVLDLAGVTVPSWMDGRSLKPFFDGSAPGSWRTSLLVENMESPGKKPRPPYSGIRRRDEVYVEYTSGEKEYYDLKKDPYQLENRPQDAPRAIKDKLSTLKECAGDGCRRADRP
jgi:arylsulfatase A-like enzyme